MERSVHRFVRLLRLHGVRVSVTEALDAMRAAAGPGALADRDTLRCVLRVALVKDRRDQELFDELFDRYFRLEPVAPPARPEHSHGHEDLADQGTAESFTISPEPSLTPRQGHSHGKPADIRDYFRPEDLAVSYNLHQEASKIDLASMTDELVLARERGRAPLYGRAPWPGRARRSSKPGRSCWPPGAGCRRPRDPRGGSNRGRQLACRANGPAGGSATAPGRS